MHIDSVHEWKQTNKETLVARMLLSPFIQPSKAANHQGLIVFPSVLFCPFLDLAFHSLPRAKEIPNYNLLKTNESNNYHLRHHHQGNDRTE